MVLIANESVDLIGEAFLTKLAQEFGAPFAKEVQSVLKEQHGKEIEFMPECKDKCKSLFAVFVVDQEADTVQDPVHVIATGEENARYKVLHKMDVEDPDTVDVFVHYIGTLKKIEK